MQHLADVERQCQSCTQCRLHQHRTQVVFGDGNPETDLMFVGEGPGFHEDQQGRPFVGPAGQLLDRMLAAIGLTREHLYIANVVKCRPPGNRNPLPEECQACLPYLRWQVRLVRPRILVCLGSVAARQIIHASFRITAQHGQWVERGGIAFVATYHPAALLRAPERKREAWDDLQAIHARLQK